MYALYNSVYAKSWKYWAFHITAYVEILTYACVYCLCIGHSISHIYCHYSDKDVFNCHKTFTIDTMFIPFWAKLFQRCINQQFWNKYLYKVTGRIHRNIGDFANYLVNGNINININIKIYSKQVMLRWFCIDFFFFTFVFIFPFMFVIRKLPINYQVIRYPLLVGIISVNERNLSESQYPSKNYYGLYRIHDNTRLLTNLLIQKLKCLTKDEIDYIITQISYGWDEFNNGRIIVAKCLNGLTKCLNRMTRKPNWLYKILVDFRQDEIE